MLPGEPISPPSTTAGATRATPTPTLTQTAMVTEAAQTVGQVDPRATRAPKASRTVLMIQTPATQVLKRVQAARTMANTTAMPTDSSPNKWTPRWRS